MLAKKCSFCICVFIATITIIEGVDPKPEDSVKKYTSKTFAGLEVFVAGKTWRTWTGVCQQPIDIQYPENHYFLSNVMVKCDDNRDEVDDGKRYSLGRVFFTDNPQKVYIVNPKDECYLYTLTNNKIDTSKIEKSACREIKKTLNNGQDVGSAGRRSLFSKIKWVLCLPLRLFGLCKS